MLASLDPAIIALISSSLGPCVKGLTRASNPTRETIRFAIQDADLANGKRIRIVIFMGSRSIRDICSGWAAAMILGVNSQKMRITKENTREPTKLTTSECSAVVRDVMI